MHTFDFVIVLDCEGELENLKVFMSYILRTF
jgi:hypothetical protein